MVTALLLSLTSREIGVHGALTSRRFVDANLLESSISFDPEMTALSDITCAKKCLAVKDQDICTAFAFNATTSSCRCGVARIVKPVCSMADEDSTILNLMVHSVCLKLSKE